MIAYDGPVSLYGQVASTYAPAPTESDPESTDQAKLQAIRATAELLISMGDEAPTQDRAKARVALRAALDAYNGTG